MTAVRRIGFHISIAGGFSKVIERARERQCRTIQFFTRNPRGWQFGPLAGGVADFGKIARRHQIHPVFVHMPYLPNLASRDKSLAKRSIESLAVELIRTAELGAPYLVMHSGSAPDPRLALEQMTRGINEALDRAKNKVVILIENTAGGGNEIGHTFEQLAAIIAGTVDKSRIGIAFDTAHAFAAGYDLRTAEAVDRTLGEFDSVVGIGRLKLVHFNDSRGTLGSHRDRHWHIGKGEIGAGMAAVLNHRRLSNKPFILETPRRDLADDQENYRVATGMIAG